MGEFSAEATPLPSYDLLLGASFSLGHLPRANGRGQQATPFYFATLPCLNCGSYLRSSCEAMRREKDVQWTLKFY